MKTRIAIFILTILSVSAYGQWNEELGAKSSKKGRYEQVQRQNNSNYQNRSYNNSELPELSKDASEALITNFDAALERRLYAMKSMGDHEESYWELMESYYYFLRNSYDKNLYNVIAINDQVWVEPQYITAMFDGSDPAQGVNDFITVLYKQKQLESKKKESYDNIYSRSNFYLGVGIGFSWGLFDPWFDPWFYPWRPYYPWNPFYYPWRPYYWGPIYPWGPVYPWGPYWRSPVIVVSHPHPVYYGTNPRGGIFAPSPSARIGGRVVTSGDPLGRSGGGYGRNSGYSGNNGRNSVYYQPQRTSPSTDRSYRNNTNQTYRNNTPVQPSRPVGGGYNGGGNSVGGGGFRSIGGGGYRR